MKFEYYLFCQRAFSHGCRTMDLLSKRFLYIARRITSGSISIARSFTKGMWCYLLQAYFRGTWLCKLLAHSEPYSRWMFSIYFTCAKFWGKKIHNNICTSFWLTLLCLWNLVANKRYVCICFLILLNISGSLSRFMVFLYFNFSFEFPHKQHVARKGIPFQLYLLFFHCNKHASAKLIFE